MSLAKFTGGCVDVLTCCLCDTCVCVCVCDTITVLSSLHGSSLYIRWADLSGCASDTLQ